MKTKSLRFANPKDAFSMTVPVLVNCGKAPVKGKEDEKSVS